MRSLVDPEAGVVTMLIAVEISLVLIQDALYFSELSLIFLYWCWRKIFYFFLLSAYCNKLLTSIINISHDFLLCTRTQILKNLYAFRGKHLLKNYYKKEPSYTQQEKTHIYLSCSKNLLLDPLYIIFSLLFNFCFYFMYQSQWLFLHVS